MRRKLIGLTALVGFLSIQALFGQTIQSPYTTFGIGDRYSTANTGQLGMGGIGIGGGHPLYLNTRNVAWLARNRFTIFDFGVEGDYRTLQSGGVTNTLASAGLRNLSFGFPIVQKPDFVWVSSVSLRPYSQVSYNIAIVDTVEGPLGTATKLLQGAGGYNSVNWGNGFRIGKNLFVGVKGTYLFGVISQESVVTFDSTLAAANVAVSERKEVEDFLWEASLGYQIEVAEETHLRLGATYQGAADVSTEVKRTLELRDRNFGTAYTTVVLDSGSATEAIPYQLGVGISAEKRFNWTIGADFDYQPWSQYRNTQGNASENLTDQWRLSIGSQIIPEYTSTRFLRRIAYNIGGHYENTSLLVNGTQITDFGINFGLSFPVSSTGSSLSTVIQLGSRGTLENDLIRENYVKLNLGIAFNQLWFIRRKYD